MRDIIISNKVNELDVICRHCGNSETAKSPFFNRFRLEGTGKNTATVRCLNCQTAVEVPLNELSTLYYHHAC
ncbi:hypothetical protein [Vreelandella arctica]|uniref:hypothetical protein n=1 Tax=Vreelandella arctica TaxID=3126499 RepID=UPI000C34377F|nr:hypothetical protein CXF87_09820 [Halomonas sp. MES3-P3E]